MGFYDFYVWWYDVEMGYFMLFDLFIFDCYDFWMLNFYSYVGNDLFNMVDLNGFSWVSIGEVFSVVGNVIVDGWC